MSVKFDNPHAFAPFYQTPIAFHGKRQGGRPVAIPVKCSIIEGTYEPAADAVAPTAGRAFDITFPRAAWRDETPPQIGEWILYWEGHREMWLKADNIGYMPDGDYCISASWEPKRRPPWSA